MNWKRVRLFVAMTLLAGAAGAADHVHRLGGGANYWTAIDDIDTENIDDNGFSYLASYQFRPGLLGIQLDFEVLPDRFGEDAYAPAGYLVLGRAVYIAAGAGIVQQDGEWADDPFYAAKAGLDLNILGNLYLDLSGSYRVDSETDLEEAAEAIDTDTVFLGATVRLGF